MSYNFHIGPTYNFILPPPSEFRLAIPTAIRPQPYLGAHMLSFQPFSYFPPPPVLLPTPALTPQATPIPAKPIDPNQFNAATALNLLQSSPTYSSSSSSPPKITETSEEKQRPSSRLDRISKPPSGTSSVKPDACPLPMNVFNIFYRKGTKIEYTDECYKINEICSSGKVTLQIKRRDLVVQRDQICTVLEKGTFVFAQELSGSTYSFGRVKGVDEDRTGATIEFTGTRGFKWREYIPNSHFRILPAGYSCSKIVEMLKNEGIEAQPGKDGILCYDLIPNL